MQSRQVNHKDRLKWVPFLLVSILVLAGGANHSAALSFSEQSPIIQGKPPTLPNPPVLISPLDDSSTCVARPRFTWSRVKKADWYQIEIDDALDFGSPNVAQTVADTTYTPQRNLPSDIYYWRVRASNAEVEGEWSATWSVTVLSLPAVPQLLAPSDGTDTCNATTNLEWSPVSNATSYRIQVDDNSDWSSPLVDATVRNATYAPDPAWPPAVYYWRVQAINDCGASSWSKTNRLTILSAPSAPRLLSPADGSSTYDRTPPFTWDSTNAAALYRIQIGDSAGLDTPLIDETVTITSYTPVSALSNGTYHWRVLTSNACGSSAWADPYKVTISNLPPTANDDHGQVTEDSTNNSLDVLANDRDENNDALRIADVAQPDHGRAEIAGAATYLEYSPDPDYFGLDGVSYSVDDGNGGTSTAWVEITVTGVNDPPDVRDDSGLTDEDASITMDVLENDRDIDGHLNPSTVQTIGEPAHGSTRVDSLTGAVTYTPMPDWNGSDHFAYRACDDGTPLPAQCDTATVEVEVQAVNDPPIADAGPDQIVETSTLVRLDGSRSYDPDGDQQLTYLWTQTEGPPVRLSSPISPSPTFAAPREACVLTFRLIVIDSLDVPGAAPDQVTVTVHKPPVFHYYVPTVFYRYTVAPDLVVKSITATTQHVSLVIANQGTMSVSGEFYVDVYIDPRSAPTAVNQTWDRLGTRGLVWAVTKDALLSLEPGGSLSLAIGDAYYVKDLSSFSGTLAVGTAVYAQVDSFNPDTVTGNVLEGHEITGAPYNNITGPVYSTAASAGRGSDSRQPHDRSAGNRHALQ